MTLIECFDQFAPQNIAGCLYLRPEKLIFLGDQAQIGQFPQRSKTFLAKRGIDTQVIYRHVPMDRIEQIVRTLADILREEDTCVIDIAGGDERILMAVGAALAGLDAQQRQKVRLQQFDLVSGTVQMLGGAGPADGVPVQLSVEELVQLQGGVLYPVAEQPGLTHSASDLDGLWELVCRDPRQWNRSISALGEFESRADSKEQVFLPLRIIRGSIPDFDRKLPQIRVLLADLEKCGAIRDHSRGDYLEYTYTSPLMRACTLKAGNVLETKALLEARALRRNGQRYFHDCRMGVHIDWDGVVHREQIPETRNEVDLILVRGTMPLFVSCKNGDIGESELYKLHTVATQFGGPHARKMLIATDLDGSPKSIRALERRAADMDIFLVTNAGTLTRRGWGKVFTEAMQRGEAT